MDIDIIEGAFGKNEDSAVDVTLNGNIIDEILDSNGEKLDKNAYSVSVDGDKAKITLNAAYLNTLKAGKYTYTIYFNPQGIETDIVELKADFVVDIEEVPLSVSVQTENSQITVGDEIIISAVAAGGDGDYTYSFLVHNKDTKKWFRLTKEFVESNSYTWNATSAGNREFFIEVKDGTGTVVRSEALNINVTEVIKIIGEASSSVIYVGDSIQLTGTVLDGSGDYTYSYLVHNKDTDKWFRFTKEFVESNSYTWNATTAGNREFFIEVKDSDGNVVRSKAINVKVVNKFTVIANSSLSDVSVGDEVVLSAEVADGKGEYTYSFIIYNKNTDKWYRLADNIMSDEYAWKAVSAGERVFYIDVKDSDGDVVRSKALEVNVK